MSPSILTSREAAPFRAGRIALGSALLLFGVEYLLQGRLAPGLPPLPAYLPSSHLLALSMGIALIVSGTLLLDDAGRRTAALIIGTLILIAACLHLRHLHAIVFEGTPRTGFLEALALGASALALAGDARQAAARSGETVAVLVARVIFALTMLIFGVQHFEYLKFVSMLVPAWIPDHSAWVIFTGVVLLLTGLAFLTRIASRAAGYGLALMFFSWLVVLHAPRIAAHVHNPDEWASGLVVLAFGGGALVLSVVTPDRTSS